RQAPGASWKGKRREPVCVNYEQQEGLCLGRHHVDARALAVEDDDAVGQREQGVVAAAADVAAGVVARAALPHDDAAGADRLAAVHLHAQPLTVGLTAVATRTLTFLVCHDGSFSLHFCNGALPGSCSLSLGRSMSAPGMRSRAAR